ncbi:MAG: phosphonate C-P lyase system protein PhnH [Pseudomonadota bacterium]
MQAVPHPSAEEARDNATFDALLWALSRPGLARTLSAPGEGTIITALLDRECRAYCADPRMLPEIMRSGAEVTEITRADHVFLGSISTNDALHAVAIGSDLYPDDGATVVIRAEIGVGPPLRMTGPGIDGEIVVRIGDLPEGFWATRAARLRYPMGFDLFFLDGDQVVGVPRSTVVLTADLDTKGQI